MWAVIGLESGDAGDFVTFVKTFDGEAEARSWAAENPDVADFLDVREAVDPVLLANVRLVELPREWNPECDPFGELRG